MKNKFIIKNWNPYEILFGKKSNAILYKIASAYSLPVTITSVLFSASIDFVLKKTDQSKTEDVSIKERTE